MFPCRGICGAVLGFLDVVVVAGGMRKECNNNYNLYRARTFPLYAHIFRHIVAQLFTRTESTYATYGNYSSEGAPAQTVHEPSRPHNHRAELKHNPTLSIKNAAHARTYALTHSPDERAYI